MDSTLGFVYLILKCLNSFLNPANPPPNKIKITLVTRCNSISHVKEINIRTALTIHRFKCRPTTGLKNALGSGLAAIETVLELYYLRYNVNRLGHHPDFEPSRNRLRRTLLLGRPRQWNGLNKIQKISGVQVTGLAISYGHTGPPLGLLGLCLFISLIHSAAASHISHHIHLVH